MGTESYTIDALIQKILDGDKQYDMSKIISAYEYADKAHEGQKRSSGEPYIVHPVSVSYILLELGMDTDTICAAMLHDVVEDTPTTLEDIQKLFGQDVALLVDGVTKLSKAPIFSQEEMLAENVRKILLAMSQDIRVMLIKLSDRLHNMRTLRFRADYKQRKTALETMNIYAPIAHRLGIKSIKEELEDLAFRYLDPFAYSEIEHILEIKKDEREKFIEKIKIQIAEKLKTFNFKEEPKIDGRVKSIYGIYKKIYINRKSIEEVYDKYAVRVIVSDIPECYLVLGAIHEIFNLKPNRFKDYISTPKANMYQSIHTTVFGNDGIPFEVQIRTYEMHQMAEYGIAAHWKYKEGIKNQEVKMEERLSWIRGVIEAQQTSDNVESIVDIIKKDLSDDIIAFSPRADAYTLPANSTIIDFAYRVHTKVGHRMTGAKVDGKMVPLDYRLKTGDIVEIITSKDENKGPNPAWIDIAETNAAKVKIRSWFKQSHRSENIEQGKQTLEREFAHYKLNVPDSELEKFLEDDLRRHSCATLDDFYAAIGYGGIQLPNIMQRLTERYKRLYSEVAEFTVETLSKKIENNDDDIIFEDTLRGIPVKYSKCCCPIPGDEIVGFITRGRGVSIHKNTCPNYLASKDDEENSGRWKRVAWSDNHSRNFEVMIRITAVDQNGLLSKTAEVISDARIPIYNSSSRGYENGNAVLIFSIGISSRDQLKTIMNKLMSIRSVISVDLEGGDR